MHLLTVGFIGGMVVQVIISLLGDRASYNPRRLVRSLRAVWQSPVMSRDLWRQLRDYNRRDFHPDDSNTDELVIHWREELFGNAGTLNDKLVRASA